MPEASAEAQAQPLEHAPSPKSHPGERPIDYELFGDGTGAEKGERHVPPGRRDRALLKGRQASDHKHSVGDKILEILHFQQPPHDRRSSMPEGQISSPVPGSGRRASTDQAFAIGGAKVETSSSGGRREGVIEESEGEAPQTQAGMMTKDLEAKDGPHTLYRCRDW